MGVPVQAQNNMLEAILAGEMMALLERATLAAFEKYLLQTMGVEDETELTAGEATTTPLQLKNDRGESPQLDIGTDEAGGLVFSPPQGQ